MSQTTIRPAGLYFKVTSWENDGDHVTTEYIPYNHYPTPPEEIIRLAKLYGGSGCNNRLGLANCNNNYAYIRNYLAENESISFENLANLLSDLSGFTEQRDIRVIDRIILIRINEPWTYIEL